jgi:hypothetical protein
VVLRFTNSLDGKIKTAADVLSYPNVTIDAILSAVQKKDPRLGTLLQRRAVHVRIAVCCLT